MKPLKTFFVEPNLPDELKILKDLAYNARWSWDSDTRSLFQRIEEDLWESTGVNPVKLLGSVNASRFSMLKQDDSFLYHLKQLRQRFEEYLAGDSTWFKRTHGEISGPVAAYFSAEFGISDCLPIFSGGLGILAGDHMKSASDMGIPLVGVGLLYQQGYFHQYLNHDGWQQETNPENDFYTMPINRVKGEDGNAITVEIPFPGRTVHAFVWLVHVGRTPLYLLDTNHPDNDSIDRQITGQLYGGDQETRIRQEIVLGMGGVRMLDQLGLEPPILHMNEGHAAFLALERIRMLMKREGFSFALAQESVMASCIFTTHTPVPAGIDVFPVELVNRYFSEYASEVGLSMEDFLNIGRFPHQDSATGFNMAILAVRLSFGTNAVSQLHGETSREMWQNLWPNVPLDEVPIGAITNGIHIPSWISNEMGTLIDRYLGPHWREDARDRVNWDRIDQIPSEELWRSHERRRERLVAFARGKVRSQMNRHGASQSTLENAAEVLDPEALTIGFARRFAPYKRATLLFRDMDRLVQILTDKNRPVQLIMAGKAHPRDHFGKDLIRTIVSQSKKYNLQGKIVFLEDYDMQIARYLVQGVDVWLNTPRRPKEASGTSGMKAVANGALHVSTMDGWWAEVKDEGIGWTIGGGEEYPESQYEYQDEVEARALYDLLENEIVPTFYKRSQSDIPRTWVSMMKHSMKTLCPMFNTNRMVRQYAERCYLPALAHYNHLKLDGWKDLKALAKWKEHLRNNWNAFEIKDVLADIGEDVVVGTTGSVKASVRLGELKPEDISLQIVFGRIGTDFDIHDTGTVAMDFEAQDKNGLSHFTGVLPCSKSGKFGFALRVLPKNPNLHDPFQMALVKIFAG